MKRYLLLLFFVATLFAPPFAYAQGAAKDGRLALLFDVDSTTLTYCRYTGATGSSFDDPITVAPRIKTVGSSVTITEFVASTNPFALVSAGDTLVVSTPTATDAFATTNLSVVTRASAASITVDTAVDLSAAGGFTFKFYKQVCGTTDADGWISISPPVQRVSLILQYDQGDLTALVARWECKASSSFAAPVILYPGESSDCGIGGTLATDRCSFATPGITARLAVNDDSQTFSYCRIGLAFTGADASDATTAREKVTVLVSVR